jgi:RNA polymerase-binding transcription factor DksA
MNSDRYPEFEAKLRATRAELKRRVDAIQSDRRRKNGPLDPDFAEQAVQRENDDTLDALDESGRRDLQAVDAALDRLARGIFGACARCGDAIAEKRLEAQPAAATCLPCASENDSH